jgi:hypothetical protein
MIFADNPTPGIPYSTIITKIYRYFSVAAWFAQTGTMQTTYSYREGRYVTAPFPDRQENIFISFTDGIPSRIWSEPVTSYFFEDGGIGQSFRKNGFGNWEIRQGQNNNYGWYPASQSWIDQILDDPAKIHLNAPQGGSIFDYSYSDILTKPTRLELLLKPQIKSYFTGYSLDPTPHKIDLELDLIPTKDGIIKIHYYYLEDEIQTDSNGVAHSVVSIQTLIAELAQAIPYHLALKCIPCSVSLEGDPDLVVDIKTQISNANLKCFPEYLPTLKSDWLSLYEGYKQARLTAKLITTIDLDATPYIWAATERWGQQTINDRNTGTGIGEYIDDSFIFAKYFNPQNDEDDTYGSYIMPDSALLKKIGNSLNVDLYQLEEPASVGNGTLQNPQIPAKHKLDWYLKNLSSAKIEEIHTALNASQYLLETPANIGTGTPQNPQISAKHKLDWYLKNLSSAKIEEIHTALNASQYLLETPAIIGTGTEEEPQILAKHRLDWYLRNITSSEIKQIHVALDAGKWGVKVDHPDPDKDPIFHVDNLGWRIQRMNEVLGIRVRADGSIDKELEKTTNRRLHAEGSAQNDDEDYNLNCFGKKGMLVRHLPNKFDRSGTVAGGYRKIIDIPQLLAELHEQANAAMGYQEGTAIEIQLDGKTYRYPNQLALMTEIFVTLKQTATYSKGTFFSSLIAEQSIKEVMAGLGLRTVDKYLEFKVAGKVTKLYYKGISASQSIRRKLSAVATNVGIVIGNII